MDERGRSGARHAPELDERQGDEISLSFYIETLAGYWRAIRIAVVVVIVAFFLGAFGAWLILPVERIGSIPFRLLFEGAAENRYPNDSPFSSTELVGTPILSEVFRINDLARFGKYNDFKETVFVQRSSREVDLLVAEYQARLADTKLTPVDRARIEQDFKSQIAALTDPSFSLSIRRSERFVSMPRELTQKVLTDTLSTWAEQAELRKGVLKYNIPVLSTKVLSREMLENKDYLAGADELRSTVVRVIATIDEMEKLPGALTMTTAEDQMSLGEIRARLEDVLHFNLEPLLGIIRSEGVTKNARELSLYAENMVFQLKLEQQAAQGRARALQAALRDYAAQTAPAGSGETTAPPATNVPRPGSAETPGLQLSESFLDRLEKMSVLSQPGEMTYRRNLTNQIIAESKRAVQLDRELAYYEGLATTIARARTNRVGSPELVATIKTRSLAAFDAVNKGTAQLSRLYEELSAKNLRPAARLYAITGPFTYHSRRALSLERVAIAFVVTMLLTLVLVPMGCIVHNSVIRRQTLPVTSDSHARV